ncbi:MAG: ABC transporter ATP-binding protein [Desulfobacterales bacterium]
MLELQNVSVAYDQVPALRDISFSVEAGEIVALIGANGAGKSTTLKAIQGVVKTNTGRIYWESGEITNIAPYRVVSMGISHCPEGRQVFPAMTVDENLKLGAIVLTDTKKKRDLLEYVYGIFPRLAERKLQLAGSLSGGEQQMLAIGRALMANPRLLMLDEPSMGLAPKLVEIIFDMIQSINAQGISILLVEQNASIALETAARAYVMENGSINLSGLASDLLHDPHVQKAYLGV